MFRNLHPPSDRTISSWTAADGRSHVGLPATCAFEPASWCGPAVRLTESGEARLGAIRSWKLQINGDLMQGCVEGVYERGKFGVLICRLKLKTDQFVHMSFDEDMVHVSFMLGRNLYRIEKLGVATPIVTDPVGPCCFLLRFAKGQEIVWQSRATNGATKVELLLPSKSFDRYYDVRSSAFPSPLRAVARCERPLAFQSIPITPDILECLDQMISWHQTSPIRGPFMRGKFHNLMSAIWFAAEQLESDLAPGAHITARERKMVANACLYIRENLASCLTIPAIAHAAATNRNKLNQMFQRLLGETVFEYVQRLRLERARSLLSPDSGRSITEVAHEVGYSDSTSFSRAYHSRFGRVPSRDLKRTSALNSQQD